MGTIVHVALDKLYAGHIVIADKIKAQAKAAIAELKALGMKEIVMLTGDMQPVAAGVAEEIGIEKVNCCLSGRIRFPRAPHFVC